MAAGSGHFIIRAGHRIARHLARVRSGEDEPSPRVYQTALRDVIGHCLYGVDINPMAVELCKVTLWLEALEPGKPLSFLDHHIRCGNSLLGATPELIAAGLPDDAFEAIEGDDKAACASLKKLNRAQREGLRHMFIAEDTAIRERLHQAAAAIDEISDSRPEDIHRKEAAFRSAQTNYDFGKAWDLANLWCAAFVIKKQFAGGAIASGAATVPASAESATLNDQPLVTQGGLFGGTEEFPKSKGKKAKASSHASSEIPTGITTQNLRDFVEGGVLPEGLLAEAKRLADQFQFFHLQLAFPEVFAQGGFDVNLGNPPWEHTELKEKEFFAERQPNIAEAPNDAIRKRLIEKLKTEMPQLYGEFQLALRQAEGESHFMRSSGLYPLSGRGRINLYPIFAERMRNTLSASGRLGVLLPSGIATDDTTKFFFQDLVEKRSLVSLFDFENRLGFFPAVDSRMKFCLFTTGSGARPIANATEFIFFAQKVDDLHDLDRRFTLTADEIARLNPNTRTCPTFRTRRDAELTKTIYSRLPVFVIEGLSDGNPWSVRFKQGLFNMATDSSLFQGRQELESEGWQLEGNTFHRNAEEYLPLYEAKMTAPFDHRAADVVLSETALVRQGQSDVLDSIAHNNPKRLPLPRYWVAKSEVLANIGNEKPIAFLGFTDVTSPTNERTMLATILPVAGVGHTKPLIFSKCEPPTTACLASNLNSFAFDYCARQKVGGIHFTYFYLKQLPVLTPQIYDKPCVWELSGQLLKDWLLPRVLELTYTAWDLEAFAQDCGWSGPPFRWDEERRFLLRCELDAAFFHLYLGPETEWRQQPAALTQAFPTPRAAVAYILDTFPIVKRKDEAKFNGDYRTKRVILEIYDALATAMQTGKAYQTRLNPAPASLAVAHLPRFAREHFNFKEAGDYILPFVASLLRHQGGECDVMILIRAYAMLLGDRKTLTTLTEARFGTEAETWVKRFNQPVDAAWFIPIIVGLDNRDVLMLEERGEKNVFVRLLDGSVPSNSTVETDVYLLLHVLDLNAAPVAAVAEQVKRISPKTIRTSIQEAKLAIA